MKGVSRRTAILGIAGATFVLGMLGTRAYRFYDSPERQLKKIIADAFGKKISREKETALFIKSITQNFDNHRFVPEEIQLAFIKSTTVIRAQETGEPLVFVGRNDPLDAPCTNTLSANWL